MAHGLGRPSVRPSDPPHRPLQRSPGLRTGPCTARDQLSADPHRTAAPSVLTGHWLCKRVLSTAQLIVHEDEMSDPQGTPTANCPGSAGGRAPCWPRQPPASAAALGRAHSRCSQTPASRKGHPLQTPGDSISSTPCVLSRGHSSASGDGPGTRWGRWRWDGERGMSHSTHRTARKVRPWEPAELSRCLQQTREIADVCGVHGCPCAATPRCQTAAAWTGVSPRRQGHSTPNPCAAPGTEANPSHSRQALRFKQITDQATSVLQSRSPCRRPDPFPLQG